MVKYKKFNSKDSAEGFAKKVNGKVIECSEKESKSGGGKYKVKYVPIITDGNNSKQIENKPFFRPSGAEWDDYAWSASDF